MLAFRLTQNSFDKLYVSHLELVFVSKNVSMLAFVLFNLNGMLQYIYIYTYMIGVFLSSKNGLPIVH